jgi:hypothetical protein
VSVIPSRQRVIRTQVFKFRSSLGVRFFGCLTAKVDIVSSTDSVHRDLRYVSSAQQNDQIGQIFAFLVIV